MTTIAMIDHDRELGRQGESALRRSQPVQVAMAPSKKFTPFDLRDYDVIFTGAELTRLQSIFPDGVCDWSKRGVNQTGVVPWASFGPSPDNLVFDVTHP